MYLSAMFGSIKDQLTQELADIEAAGLYKRERVITSAQDAEITLLEHSQIGTRWQAPCLGYIQEYLAV